MPRSTHAPAYRALTFRALRAISLGASLFTLACSYENDAPFKPADFDLEGFEESLDLNHSPAQAGLIPNTAQLVRLATDTTRCLAIADDESKRGNPVIVAKCSTDNSSNSRMLFRFTSAGEVRTSANACIGAHGESPRVGSLIAVVKCDGKPSSRWQYDAGQHLLNGTGGCLTVAGMTLSAGAKTKVSACASPAPWSQKVWWNTPGTPVTPNPNPPPPTPTPPPSTPSPTVASVRISPATNTVFKGDSIRLTPTAYNAAGQPVPAVFAWSVASGGSFVSVSPQGVVKGLSLGTATIAARAAGFTGTATVTVSTATSPPSPPVPPSTPTIPGSPPPAGVAPSVPPTLPLSTVDVSWRPPTGQTITVSAGGNLQAALNQAKRGDEIVIQAGATFTGTFILPAKSGTPANGWITIRTSALNSLPPQGTRITPSHAAAMPKLVASGPLEVLMTQAGASGWRVVGIEITMSPSLNAIHHGLVSLGDGSPKQAQISQVPYDLILDRVYVHGQPNVSITRCVALNSARTAIVDSQLLECHGRGFDSQAIAGWNGPGPYRIENNRLEGAGEVIMFGGADPAITNLVPSDVTIRRNYFYRPTSWKGVWTVKNLFELKNAQRVLVEGNVMENNWVDGQVGYALMIGSANQNGKCNWCIVQDLMVRYNHIHNSAGGIDVFERHPNAQSVRRVALHHNLLTSIGASGLGNNGKMFLLLDGVDDLSIEHNTGFAPQTYMTFNNFVKHKNRFTFRNNIGGGAQYNIHSSEGLGTAALSKHLATPYMFAGNVFVGSNVGMPAANSYAANQLLLGFVNAVPVGGSWALSALSLFFKVGTGGITPGVNWGTLTSLIANVRL